MTDHGVLLKQAEVSLSKLLIKHKKLTTMFETFVKSISQALVLIISALQTTDDSLLTNQGPCPHCPMSECYYCGKTSHAIAVCPHVVNDIQAGHYAHGHNGHIILPIGSYVSASLPGNTI